MKRTLHLTNPLMHGSDVRAAQTLLHKHNFLAASDIDGSFGPHSAHACEVAKFRLGYAAINIKPTYGETLNGFLSGKTVLPKEYKGREAARANTSYLEFEELALRHKIVTVAQWGIHNNPSIHYEQSRPIDGTNHPYKLPLYTDCSGFVTLCYEWAGAPDPNGRGFDGLGYTGTLLQHMHQIMQSQVKIADLVVWGNYPGHHVALVMGGPINDPLLASHGKEIDPHDIHFRAESRFQPAAVHWLRLPQWA